MSIIKHVTLQQIVAHDFRYDPRKILPLPAIELRFFGCSFRSLIGVLYTIYRSHRPLHVSVYLRILYMSYLGPRMLIDMFLPT